MNQDDVVQHLQDDKSNLRKHFSVARSLWCESVAKKKEKKMTCFDK